MINKIKHKTLMDFKEYCSSCIPLFLTIQANQIRLNFITYRRIKTAIKRPIISEVKYYKMLEMSEMPEDMTNLTRIRELFIWPF